MGGGSEGRLVERASAQGEGGRLLGWILGLGRSG